MGRCYFNHNISVLVPSFFVCLFQPVAFSKFEPPSSFNPQSGSFSYHFSCLEDISYLLIGLAPWQLRVQSQAMVVLTAYILRFSGRNGYVMQNDVCMCIYSLVRNRLNSGSAVGPYIKFSWIR